MSSCSSSCAMLLRVRRGRATFVAVARRLVGSTRRRRRDPMFVPVDCDGKNLQQQLGTRDQINGTHALISKKISGCATGETLLLWHAATCLLLVPARSKTSAMEREGLL